MCSSGGDAAGRSMSAQSWWTRGLDRPGNQSAFVGQIPSIQLARMQSVANLLKSLWLLQKGNKMREEGIPKGSGIWQVVLLYAMPVGSEKAVGSLKLY